MRRRFRHLSFAAGGAFTAPAPAPAPVAVAPTITSGNSFSAAENQTGVGTVTATGDGPLVYSLDAGGDAALLAIDSSTGVLTFADAPNFELPADANTDNAYQATVRVTGATSPAATQAITVSVTNVADVVPIVTASQSFSVSESVSTGATVGTVAVTAGDSAVTAFAIVSGNTGTAFAISSSGVITTAAALDYATLSSYTLGVTATNSAGTSSAVNVGVTVTEAVDWPSVVAFADYPNPPPIVAMSVPALRTPTLDPRMTTPHVPGGVVQTKLTRISDVSEFDPALSGSGWNNFGPEYALLQHWSKDGDMMLVRATSVQTGADSDPGKENPHALYTAMHVLHGTTYAYQSACYDTTLGRGVQGGNWRWSNSVNDEIVCLRAIDTNFADPILWRYTPTTRLWSTIKDFSATYDYHYRGFKYTGEATQTRDGRYWALCLRKPTTQWYIVIYDRVLDVVTREWAVSSDITSHNISVGVSPLGTYMWTASFGGEVVAGNTLAGGVNVFSVATGALVAHLGEMNGGSNPIGHTGPNTDPSGNEIWTWGHGTPAAGLNERAIVSWRMDGSQGTSYTTHLPAGKYLGFDYLNHCVPGHIVWSDYPVPASNGTYSDFPLRGQMFIMPLDGSGNVKLVTSSRFSMVNYTPIWNNGYDYGYPWATPSRDGSRVLFKSGMSNDWSSGITSVAHAFIASA